MARGAPKLAESEYGFGLEESHSLALGGGGGWITQSLCGRRGLPSRLAVLGGRCAVPDPTGPFSPRVHTAQWLLWICREIFDTDLLESYTIKPRQAILGPESVHGKLL